MDRMATSEPELNSRGLGGHFIIMQRAVTDIADLVDWCRRESYVRQTSDTITNLLKVFMAEIGLIAHWANNWSQRPMPKDKSKVALNTDWVKGMGAMGPGRLHGTFFDTSAEAQVTNITIQGVLQTVPHFMREAPQIAGQANHCARHHRAIYFDGRHKQGGRVPQPPRATPRKRVRAKG